MQIKSPASPFYSPKGNKFAAASNNNKNALSNIPILITAFLAILATGGPTYSFGVYAATLKHSLGLTQSQLETLGSASFAAGFISWIPGLAVDLWGSRTALIAGGLLQSVGLGLYWAVARFGGGLLGDRIVPTLSFLSVLVFTSNNLVIGGVFKAIVVSCGLGTKGKAVGAAKAYLGMGAGVFSSLFRALPLVNDLDFLAMSSVAALLAICVPSFLMPTNEQMEQKGTKDDSTDRHYTLVYAGLLAVALVVVGTSAMDLLPASGSSFRVVPDWLHALVIVAVWIGPILGLSLLPTQSGTMQEKFQRQQSVLRRKVRQAMERDHGGETQRLLPANTTTSHLLSPKMQQPQKLIPPPITASSGSMDSCDSDDLLEKSDNDSTTDPTTQQETPQPVPDLTLLEMLTTLRAWLFLVASTILVGSGTMLTINMGQLVQSQMRPETTAAASLSLFSVAQSLARVLAGAVSEAALSWETQAFGIARGVPRPAFLVVSCALAVAGHGILALYSSQLPMFVLGIVLTGFSFGGLWPLMVLIVGDLFGTVNHGANYMFMDGFTCAVGTLSMAKFLTQRIYEQHLPEAGSASEDSDDGGFNPNACYGDDCFRLTHLVIAGLCSLSLVACTALLYMTRSSYGALL